MVGITVATAASLASSAMLLAQHAATASVASSPATRGPSTLAFVSPVATRSRHGDRGVPSAVSPHCLESKHPVPFTLHPTRLSRALPSSDDGRRPRRARTPLCATIDDGALETNIVERLELDRQFERWRFFQRLLDGELPASDVEDVLLSALEAYLRHGPTATSSNNRDENGGNASPVLTEEQRSSMEELVDAMVSVSDGIGDSRFLHMLVLPPVDYESTVIDVDEETTTGEGDNLVAVDPNALSILRRMERLLPDPVEDEEAFQSAWDVVIDLHGREAVRVKEEASQREWEGVLGDGLECCAENLQWRTLCTVGRVLIHFDFLTKGVLNEGTFE